MNECTTGKGLVFQFQGQIARHDPDGSCDATGDPQPPAWDPGPWGQDLDGDGAVHALAAEDRRAAGDQGEKEAYRGVVTWSGRRPRQDSSLVDTCTDTKYGILVVKTFGHRALKRLFQQGDPSKVH